MRIMTQAGWRRQPSHTLNPTSGFAHHAGGWHPGCAASHHTPLTPQPALRTMQVGWHPGCAAAYLGAGTCDITCKRCTPCAGYDYCHNCRDAPPGGSNFTCAQQARPPLGLVSTLSVCPC